VEHLGLWSGERVATASILTPTAKGQSTACGRTPTAASFASGVYRTCGRSSRLPGSGRYTRHVRSIRVYLLILVLGAMLPGALLTGILVWRNFTNNRAFSERRLLESARVDASALDREFASTISTLRVLATSRTLDRDDFEAFHLEGRRVQSTQSGWYTIVLLSLDGRPLVSTRTPWGEPLEPVVDPDSLQQVIATGQANVGMVRDSPSGGPDHVFPIRVPVVRRERLKYILSAIINVDALTRVVPRQRNSDEWTRALLDSAGTIAVRTRGEPNYVGSPAREEFRARIRQRVESVSSETTLEGNRVYAAISPSQSGWTAVIAVPRHVLDAPLLSSMAAVLPGGVVLALCGLAAVLVISRRLSDDLAVATASAEAVAQGRPLPRAEAHVAETLQLQRSLATTASLLEQRARERDEEVRRADGARTEAERANRTKDQFLAVLGHELRNPLAPTVTALELMKRRDPNMFTREREVLERQVAHMSRLVNDLLDVARLTQGRVRLEPRRFELCEAVERATDMARPLIAQQRHALHVSVPETGLALDADRARIVQVLSNLLTNAARYTPPGGHITVTAAATDGHVTIAVDDDGPGLPAELVPHLFEPFAQGPRALDRREGGLGLGLALARTFTELHGGTIRLEAHNGAPGSRFVVELPLASATAPRQRTPAPTPSRVAAQRVLLVDDNADAREMLRLALEQAGHIVATASDGPSALDVTATFRPDVGVLDIGLPGMDGYELARRLRDGYPQIRLIALSGYSQLLDRATARDAGFDAHCAKPVSTTVLLDRIAGREPVSI
jgi:signal transduction histidine kinase